MRADPEPDDFIPFQDPYRSMARVDPSKVDWTSRMHRFETKTGMTRVLFKESIGAMVREITASLGRAPQSGQHGVQPMLRQRVGQADHGN